MARKLHLRFVPVNGDQEASVKVFISVDMEGVSGITDPEDVLPDGADYQRGRVFMTGDANAAIYG
jgi:D-amino peptidase